MLVWRLIRALLHSFMFVTFVFFAVLDEECLVNMAVSGYFRAVLLT